MTLGIWAKFTLLLAGAVALTLAVYHGIVRRADPLRWSLGMKPKPSPGPGTSVRRMPAVAGFDR